MLIFGYNMNLILRYFVNESFINFVDVASLYMNRPRFLKKERNYP